MILTGHQPNYLPYLGFFDKIEKSDLFLIVDNVQFVKRGPFGWIHRNKIRSPQGWQWLSLDCLTKGKYTQNINEVQLKPGSPILRKHWKAIEVNYKKASHFHRYQEAFKEIYEAPWTHMNDLNIALIKALLKALGITTPVDTTSHLNITGQSSELIINMCQHVGASSYLSGIHGQDYLQYELFDQAQIKVIFQNYSHPTYTQCWPGTFEPYMSTLDLIFNEGPNALKILTSG